MITTISKRLFCAAATALFAFATAAGAGAKGDGGPPFTDAEYAPYAPGATGSGVVTGTLVLRGPGRPIAGANTTVWAFPDTDYTRWYLGRRVASTAQTGGVLPKQNDSSTAVYPVYDDKIAPDVRQTQSDRSGRFVFTRLPSGSYILVAQFATVSTATMPRQAEDASYGNASVDDYHAPPPSEFKEDEYYYWLVGSRPVAVANRRVDVGALRVYTGYFCGPLQLCTEVNSFTNAGENQGDKLDRALGIGAKHGYLKRRTMPVVDPQEAESAG